MSGETFTSIQGARVLGPVNMNDKAQYRAARRLPQALPGDTLVLNAFAPQSGFQGKAREFLLAFVTSPEYAHFFCFEKGVVVPRDSKASADAMTGANRDLAIHMKSEMSILKETFEGTERIIVAQDAKNLYDAWVDSFSNIIGKLRDQGDTSIIAAVINFVIMAALKYYKAWIFTSVTEQAPARLTEAALSFARMKPPIKRASPSGGFSSQGRAFFSSPERATYGAARAEGSAGRSPLGSPSDVPFMAKPENRATKMGPGMCFIHGRRGHTTAQCQRQSAIHSYSTNAATKCNIPAMGQSYNDVNSAPSAPGSGQ